MPDDEAPKQPGSDPSEAPTQIGGAPVSPTGPQSPQPGVPPEPASPWSPPAVGPQSPAPDAAGGAATATTTPGPAPETGEGADPISCPNCGAKAEAGQLVCLECGERLALDYKKPPSWRLPAIIVGIVLLLAGAGLAIALSRIGDDAEKVAKAPEPTQQLQTATPTSAAPTVTTNTATTGPATKTTKAGKSKVPKIDTSAAPPVSSTPSVTPKPGPSPAPKPTPTPTDTGTDTTTTTPEVAAWPTGKTAYTVVLLSLQDEEAANRAAKRAKAKGLDGVGVLNSDDYSTLNPGFFVVFHKQFRLRDEADKQVVRDAREGYDQAYSRRVRPNKS